jgi:integrase
MGTGVAVLDDSEGAVMGGRRAFGEIERRHNRSGSVTYRARYMMLDGSRYSRTFGAKIDAEAWLASERSLVDRDEWSSPSARQAAANRQRMLAATSTVATYAERYLQDPDRDLRPSTVRAYRQMLRSYILPKFAASPLAEITSKDIRAWRVQLNPSTPAANAAAYRLLRSLLQAAEEEELIGRAPSKVRGASKARTQHIATPATLDELATIHEHMPERLKLFIVLAAFVGLREGELLELRRSDVDDAASQISITRKVEKDADPSAKGACRSCGRVIGPPKTVSGSRVVHVPPPFLTMLRHHLAQFAGDGSDGLLFPGDRKDHMSVRYVMDRYRPAREAAGRPDLTIHHLRHTALTIAGQHGATAAELQARAGHASQAAMALYQHGTRERDRSLAAAIGATYESWAEARGYAMPMKAPTIV